MAETRDRARFAGGSTVAVIGAWIGLAVVRNASAGITDGVGPAVESLAFDVKSALARLSSCSGGCRSWGCRGSVLDSLSSCGDRKQGRGVIAQSHRG